MLLERIGSGGGRGRGVSSLYEVTGELIAVCSVCAVLLDSTSTLVVQLKSSCGLRGVGLGAEVPRGEAAVGTNTGPGSTRCG